MNPNNGNYDFILNSGATKTNKFSMGNSPLKKVLIGFGIFVFLMIILIISTSGGGNSNVTTAFENIVVAQQKLINVSKNDFNSTNQSTQLTTNQINSLATITAVLSSDQNQILQYLKQSSISVPSNLTTSVTTSSLDAQINTAVTSGTLSNIYPSFFQTNLNSYLGLIKTCYSLTTGKNGRALLTDIYNNATLLLKQSQN